MDYHAERHAWPAVPWHTLADIHARVDDHIDSASGYLALRRVVYASLARG